LFDVGYWTRIDLLHCQLASPDHLSLQIMLLEALSKYSGCSHCSALASHWRDYQNRFAYRVRYLITSSCASYSRHLIDRIRVALFPKSHSSDLIRVCIPIPAHPFTGGILTVLNGVAQVTRDVWQTEYLVHEVLPNREQLIIHRFGTAKMGPWQFPMVWLYFLAGFWKLISLMHNGANYRLVIPQDGVYTAAFAALAAKLAGVRVVCMDHAHLTLLKSRTYRVERIQALGTRKWYRRLLSRLLYVGYWPSFSLFALIAKPFVDHYFLPGITGDGLEEICEQLGIYRSHITRFANMIDMDRHPMPDAIKRVHIREKMGIATDAVVITMICRLSIEKGLDIAVEAISQALSTLSPILRSRVLVVIAGDGPVRKLVEEDVYKREQSQIYVFFGEASAEDVSSILGISDIFLYTSTRGVGYPLAILEAMASGCAVVASDVPLANSYMLAEGRGIVVHVGDVEQTRIALVQLINDPMLRHHTGSLARDYVANHHSASQLRRSLVRVTYWSALDEILGNEIKIEAATIEKEDEC
jgi:glycosyltransferase involved in cell wall biosynthesis